MSYQPHKVILGQVLKTHYEWIVDNQYNHHHKCSRSHKQSLKLMVWIIWKQYCTTIFKHAHVEQWNEDYANQDDI